MTKRILVTGAQGFVGRYFVAESLSLNENVEVLGVGRSPGLTKEFKHLVSCGDSRIPAPLPPGLQITEHDSRYRYVQADLLQPELLRGLLRSFRPNVVVHLASGLRDDPPVDLLRSNVEGTVQLILAIAGSGIETPRLLVSSSGGVYGIPSDHDLPVRETAPCAPVDFYSASKLAQEHVSRILAQEYKIPTVWARLFNLLGPGQDERHVGGKFASLITAIGADRHGRLLTTGPLTTTRDFIDVRDVAAALLRLVDKGVPGTTYNVASGVESPIGMVLRTMLRLTGLQVSVKIESKSDGRVDIPRHFADTTRLRSLGFRPQYTLSESLADLLKYYTQYVANSGSGSEGLL
jgi:GDP-4-dehydro-6-deoxy-D-mannose reductase